MRLLHKIISTMSKAGHENYCSFCRRWEANWQALRDAPDGQALIGLLSSLLADGEEARIEDRQYLTVTGNGYKYTARLSWPEKGGKNEH